MVLGWRIQFFSSVFWNEINNIKRGHDIQSLAHTPSRRANVVRFLAIKTDGCIGFVFNHLFCMPKTLQYQPLSTVCGLPMNVIYLLWNYKQTARLNGNEFSFIFENVLMMTEYEYENENACTRIEHENKYLKRFCN